MASNAPEVLPLPVADGCVLGPIIDCNGELTSSTRLTVLDCNGRTEDTAEPTVRQQLLQSSDESNHLLTRAGQFEKFDMTISRDEAKQGDVVFNEDLGRRPEALGKDERDRHEIERIIGRDEHNGRKRYLVKWSGWPEEEATWEPEGNLDNCSDIVKEYWASVGHPDTISNTPGTRSRSIKPSNGVGDDRVSLLQPMAKILDQLGKSILIFQNLLATQSVQQEASDRSVSGCIARKRKISQEVQDLSDEDEEDTIAYRGAGEGRKPRITRKRQRKHCGRCKEAGHNSRTCTKKSVSINN